MIIVKSRMADDRVAQVIAAAPASLVRHFDGHLQPHGVNGYNDSVYQNVCAALSPSQLYFCQRS